METTQSKLKKSSERKLLQVRDWQRRNKSDYLEMQRRWRQIHPEYARRWRETHPERCREHAKKGYWKHHDRMAVRNQSRSARFKRESKCAQCGLTEKLEGHHPDYSKTFLLITLCRRCHHKLHEERP